MRNYVVNHRCRNVSSFRHTLHTQRMLTEISLAYSLPLAAVATLGGGRAIRVQRLVFVAVRTLG